MLENLTKIDLIKQLRRHKEFQTNFDFELHSSSPKWVKANSKIGIRINKIAKNNGLENTSVTTIFSRSINESEHREELGRHIKINEIELAYDCIFSNCEKIIKQIDEKKEDAETKERKELRIKKQNNELLKKLNKLDEFEGEFNKKSKEGEGVLKKNGVISNTLNKYINRTYPEKDERKAFGASPTSLFSEALFKSKSAIEKKLKDESSVSIRSIIFKTAEQILIDKIRQKNRGQMTLKNKHLRSLKLYADKTDKWYAGGHIDDSTIAWDKSIQDFIKNSKYDAAIKIYNVKYFHKSLKKFIVYPKDQEEADKDPAFQGLAEGYILKWQVTSVDTTPLTNEQSENIEDRRAEGVNDYISEMDIQHAKDKLVKELIKRDSICKRYVDVIQNLLLKFGLDNNVTAQKYRSLSTSIMNEKDQKKCLAILKKLMRKNDEIKSLIFDAYN